MDDQYARPFVADYRPAARMGARGAEVMIAGTTMETVLARHAEAYGDEHDEDCPLCGVDSLGMRRPGRCQHLTISDADLADREELILRTMDGVDSLICPDCREYLYPHGDTVYVGEPYSERGGDAY